MTMTNQMENRDLVAAANALIDWFNSQEVSSKNAEAIMLKVIAKLIVKRINANESVQIKVELDDHHRVLAHEIVERIYQMKNKP
jgi:hypothetical protein